jgi:2,4-dienoyl-CoA reductase-like NADH-dependent reductase (Old Yellow Enzyme family)
LTSKLVMELSIAKPITLKCGLKLPNRLTKAAMAEGFADKDHLPGSKECLAAYSAWAKGGWGLVITGEKIVRHKPSLRILICFRKCANRPCLPGWCP